MGSLSFRTSAYPKGTHMRFTPISHPLPGLLAALVLATAMGGCGHGGVTGDQVMEKSHKAYGALKSYSGVSKSYSSITLNGKQTALDAHATIRFVRPGKIQVQ